MSKLKNIIQSRFAAYFALIGIYLVICYQIIVEYSKYIPNQLQCF